MFLSLKWSFLRQYWVNCLVILRFPMLYRFFYGRKSFWLWQTFLIVTDIFGGDRHFYGDRHFLWWQTFLVVTDIFCRWQTFLIVTYIFGGDRHFWWFSSCYLGFCLRKMWHTVVEWIICHHALSLLVPKLNTCFQGQYTCLAFCVWFVIVVLSQWNDRKPTNEVNFYLIPDCLIYISAIIY